MLTSIGKKTKSLLVKIFVGIIILPFIFWGMGGVFSDGNSNNIAKINNQKITTQEFMNYLNNSKINPSTIKENIENNILEEMLSEMISKTLIKMEIEDYNILLSEESLANIIKKKQKFF